MTQSFFIPTTVGRNKFAGSLGTGDPIQVSEFAFGTGSRVPTGGETSLETELFRKPVVASGLYPDIQDAAFFEVKVVGDDLTFPVQEVGLYDDDGDMIGIGYYENAISKIGETFEITLTQVMVISDLENLVIQLVSPDAKVAAARLVSTEDGIDGGGDLSQDRTHKLAFQKLEERTAAQVVEAENDIDWFAFHDSSSGVHRKIKKSELAKALGVDVLVQTVGDLTIPAFASTLETIAGELSNKKTHPAGVKAAIDVAFNDRRHYEFFTANY